MRDQGQNQSKGFGLELVGGLLFIAGAIPMAAVAKALIDGTDLTAPNLGAIPGLAATVVQWLGAWPGILTTAAVAAVGALIIVGHIRSEPLRYVGGAIVSGFGVAAIASAIAFGSGGQLGDGVAGMLGGGFLGVLAGLVVIAGALWLALAGPREDALDEDGFAPVRERADGFGIGQTLAGAAAAGAGAIRAKLARKDDEGVKASREARRIQPKRRRPAAAPATLGDALAQRGTEGVSHDEAAALAPDDKTLAYMESVWRNAADSFKQVEPVPPSPYPEDVRLKGGIPEGAAPLSGGKTAVADLEEAPLEDVDVDAAPADAPDFAAAAIEDVYVQRPAASAPPAPMPPADVAPFDFADELGAPVPLADPPAAAHAPTTPRPAAKPADEAPEDPFGVDPNEGELGAPRPLAPEEVSALEAAARSEGVAAPAEPRSLPEGVKPLEPRMPEDVDTTQDAVRAGAEPAQPTRAPQPAWERGYDDEEGALEADYDVEDIADVDPATGHWPRRADEEADEAAPSSLDTPYDAEAAARTLDEALASLGVDVAALEAAEAEATEAPVAEATPAPALEVADVVDEAVAADEEVEAEDDTALEAEAEAETDEVEAEFEDEAELEAEEEADLEDETEAELEDEEAEDDGDEVEAELEEDEDVEYEYVDEDGNPIDPSELAEGEWEEVDEDDEEAAELEDEEGEEDEEAAELEDAEEEEYEDEDAEAELDEEDEDVEYEYVDEDGNPIDPSELAEGEWEEVDEDEEEAAELEDEEEAELEEDEGAELEDEEADEEAELEDEPEAELADDEVEAADEDEPEAAADAEYEEAEDELEEDAEAEVEADTPVAATADDPFAASAEDLPSFDDGFEYEDADDTEVPSAAEPAPAEAAERDVVLVPEPRPALELSADAHRLFEAGRVLVREGRVAVSLLQKEFGVQFDEACELLDELQSEGLIGPYKNGKARDILLSADEWEGRFAGA